MAKNLSSARLRQIEYLSDPDNKEKYLKYQREYQNDKWHNDPDARMRMEISHFEWREKNQDKIQETQRKYRKENKDKINAQKRESRKIKIQQDPNYKKKEQEKNRLYREQNREQINARKREKYQNDPVYRLKKQEKARESMSKSRKKVINE